MSFACFTVFVIVALAVVLYAARCDDRMERRIEEMYNERSRP
jgi:hypothetical protein